jgi:Secretion system C-terminal sorting domain
MDKWKSRVKFKSKKPLLTPKSLLPGLKPISKNSMKKTVTLLLIAFSLLQKGFGNPAPPPVVSEYIRSLLNVVAANGTTTLLDGDLTQYNNAYSDTVDGFDARKISNPGENIGMLRNGVVLSIERRQVIQTTDTIFYETWNLNPARNYQLEFITVNLNHPGLVAYLVDSYLGTSTPVALNDTTLVNFNINSDPASYNIRRFTLVYLTPSYGTLPLTFTAVKAYQVNETVKVDWQTSNENNLQGYTVERSVDGSNFTSLGSVPAGNLPDNDYTFTDPSPSNGYNYYRIKSITIDGRVAYSDIMKVYMGSGAAVMKVFPNPISGNVINLQMINEPADLYQVRVMNTFGQVIISKQLQYSGGNSTQTFTLPGNLSHGVYEMEITGSGGTTTNISLLY